MSDPGLASAGLAPGDRRNRVMWLNADRVFYAGLLGQVSPRTLGGWLVYVALGAPLRVALGPSAGGLGGGVAAGGAAGAADWVSTDLAVLPPHTPHRVACDDRLICSLIIEPETVDDAALPLWLRQRDGVQPLDRAAAAQLVLRVRQAHTRLRQVGSAGIDLDTAGFDLLCFGHGLPARRVDPRIARVLAPMRDDPARAITAQQGAVAAGLSFSRFLHVFKAEAGSPFRSLRTWKRARSLLHHVTRDSPLVHVALDAGYPDSTHFSHSVRQVYGLKPSDLFAGSRRLTVLDGRTTAVPGA